MTGGSLCTGYGGLDLAVHALLPDLDMRWVSEIDKDASAVLASRFPGVPNIGDLTVADPEPVDVLTAGFPCQPVSQAGRRKGINDERWLWDDIADLVGRMGAPPRMLLLENVPGLLAANGGDAMARVVHRLAELGYVGSWRTLRASDVGACHARSRVLIIAVLGEVRELMVPTRINYQLPRAVDGRLFPTPTAWLGRRPSHSDVTTSLARFSSGHPTLELTDAVALLPTASWGDYADAIARHATVMGTEPPPPTVGKRLNPAFVEWMMMLPAGWVTDVDISHTAKLRILGNGVVPPQAAAAYTSLLGGCA